MCLLGIYSLQCILLTREIKTAREQLCIHLATTERQSCAELPGLGGLRR
jgi:hypothetical protein